MLLYHVVPGATVTYRQALRSDGAALTTASGGTVTVDVVVPVPRPAEGRRPQRPQPLRRAPDINQGNQQIAHGISEVLRPLDL